MSVGVCMCEMKREYYERKEELARKIRGKRNESNYKF